MKTRNIILFALMTVFGLSSCDKNKSQIEETVKVFSEALKTSDVATIYDLYPDAKLLANMSLPKGIQMADVDIEKEDSTGIYTATIKNPREQKLLFKVLDEGKLQITDSYGLFEMSKEYSDLAVKSGMPLKNLSDKRLNELFEESGDYISFIKKKFDGITDFKLSDFNGVYVNNSSWVDITQNIRNDGNFRVKGTDYDVIFTFRDKRGINPKYTKTIAGVDLEPGETFTYYFNLNGYSGCAYDEALTWKVTFNQKRGGSLKDLVKKAKFDGTEYDEFIKQQTKEDKK